MESLKEGNDPLDMVDGLDYRRWEVREFLYEQR